MKAFEFRSRMNPDQSLAVPRDVALQIPKDQTLQVVLLFSESSEDADWQRLTAEQFVRGYSEGDSIYDAL